jgi:class 3 adenylate cyclase
LDAFSARALVAMVSQLDVRAALPLIQAPTLVLHTTGDRFIPVGHSRYLHAHIDGSRLVEIAGGDHHPTGTSSEQLVEEIAEFLTGSRPAPRSERVLATVMFTDIIGSTSSAAGLGNERWRHMLDRHDTLVRAELSSFRGVEIKATGDGPSEILVSSTVTDLVAGSGIQFEDRGRHELKGVPGTWQLYAVLRASGRDARRSREHRGPNT